MISTSEVAVRAPVLHFTDEPDPRTGSGYEYLPDGVLLVADGHVRALESAGSMADKGFDLDQCDHFPDHLLMPGLVDTHIHYPQTDVIASYGEQLIDWLNHYTFPAEMRFSCAEHASHAADDFLNLLLESGTTTAMVYTTIFAASVDAFFEAAHRRNLRMIAGRMLMDRNAPPWLMDSVVEGERESRELIEKWHRNERLLYAVSPRFAPTSSPEQLAMAGRLYSDYDELYLQTHLSENRAEIDWVESLFPEARDYLDVYDRHGLLGPGSVFGHGIHLSERELGRLADTDSRVAFCPTSNLFLGSGLFNLGAVEAAGIDVGLGTDVGGGTSFSLIKTLSEAYKVLQLQGQSLHPLKAFYRVTLGNARALRLEERIGSLEVGKEADFVLLDPTASCIQEQRQQAAVTLEEMLFALQMLGDERNVARTYVMGEIVYERSGVPVEGKA